MPSVPSTARDWLLAIEARLGAVVGLPPERILEWLGNDPPPNLQADSDLVLRLGGITVEGDWQRGGNRYTLHLAERLQVQIRSRLLLDEPNNVRLWLTTGAVDAAGVPLGHVALRSLVIDALQGFVPVDAAGIGLTLCEVHLGPGEAPRPSPHNSGWGEETLTFIVRYLHRLTPDLPIIGGANGQSTTGLRAQSAYRRRL